MPKKRTVAQKMRLKRMGAKGIKQKEAAKQYLSTESVNQIVEKIKGMVARERRRNRGTSSKRLQMRGKEI